MEPPHPRRTGHTQAFSEKEVARGAWSQPLAAGLDLQADRTAIAVLKHRSIRCEHAHSIDGPPTLELMNLCLAGVAGSMVGRQDHVICCAVDWRIAGELHRYRPRPPWVLVCYRDCPSNLDLDRAAYLMAPPGSGMVVPETCTRAYALALQLATDLGRIHDHHIRLGNLELMTRAAARHHRVLSKALPSELLTLADFEKHASLIPTTPST